MSEKHVFDRLQMLVEAETAEGQRHSTLLQNAETVRLVGPKDSAPAAAGSAASESAAAGSSTDGSIAAARQQWQAVAVTELRPGQQVYLLRQAGARHTGISIQENINEK